MSLHLPATQIAYVFLFNTMLAKLGSYASNNIIPFNQ